MSIFILHLVEIVHLVGERDAATQQECPEVPQPLPARDFAYGVPKLESAQCGLLGAYNLVLVAVEGRGKY